MTITLGREQTARQAPLSEVDPEVAAVALQRCVDLLVRLGGAVAAPGFTVVGAGPAPVEIGLRSRR